MEEGGINVRFHFFQWKKFYNGLHIVHYKFKELL